MDKAQHWEHYISRKPLEKGSLFKVTRDSALPEWSVEVGITNWTQFFLTYILSHPAVTCVIPATSNPEHMLQNIEPVNIKLLDDRMKMKMKYFIDKV